MTSTTVTYIKTMDEFRTLLESDKPVVIDFTATWCPPCRRIAPLYEKLAKQHANGLTLVKVDVDDANEVSEHCGVTCMPTFQVYVKGNKVDELKGASDDALQAMLDKYDTTTTTTEEADKEEDESEHKEEVKA